MHGGGIATKHTFAWSITWPHVRLIVVNTCNCVFVNCSGTTPRLTQIKYKCVHNLINHSFNKSTDKNCLKSLAPIIVETFGTKYKDSLLVIIQVIPRLKLGYKKSYNIQDISHYQGEPSTETCHAQKYSLILVNIPVHLPSFHICDPFSHLFLIHFPSSLPLLRLSIIRLHPFIVPKL